MRSSIGRGARRGGECGRDKGKREETQTPSKHYSKPQKRPLLPPHTWPQRDSIAPPPHLPPSTTCMLPNVQQHCVSHLQLWVEHSQSLLSVWGVKQATLEWNLANFALQYLGNGWTKSRHSSGRPKHCSQRAGKRKKKSKMILIGHSFKSSKGVKLPDAALLFFQIFPLPSPINISRNRFTCFHLQ